MWACASKLVNFPWNPKLSPCIHVHLCYVAYRVSLTWFHISGVRHFIHKITRWRTYIIVPGDIRWYLCILYQIMYMYIIMCSLVLAAVVFSETELSNWWKFRQLLHRKLWQLPVQPVTNQYDISVLVHGIVHSSWYHTLKCCQYFYTYCYIRGEMWPLERLHVACHIIYNVVLHTHDVMTTSSLRQNDAILK